jgi:hypothetical protein
MNNDSEYMMDPQGRPRFYGIYSGQVTGVNDPLKQNRIQVLVHGPTGVESHNWAPACLPITSSSYHPDHEPHTAAQIADLLTTTAINISGTDSRGDSHTIAVPALTVVAKDTTKQLNHKHVTATKTMVNKNVVVSSPTSTTDTLENSLYTTASGLSAPGTTSSSTSNKVPEHTFHRTIPAVNQLVWVMFIAGDPDYPVWIGVQS